MTKRFFFEEIMPECVVSLVILALAAKAVFVKKPKAILSRGS